MKLPELPSFKGAACRADWWCITIVCAFIDAFALSGGLIAASSLSIPCNYLAISLSSFVLLLSV